jgi:alpha-beta hydrolase superfamily lysophospholipase
MKGFSMSDRKHIVLIHGTWGHGSDLAEIAREFEKRGFAAHNPTLLWHDLPLLEGALKTGIVSLLDYVDDLVKFVRTLDTPPIIAGASMGGLLAQLVAARTPHKAMILFAPAPAAGMFTMYPSMVAIFIRHFIQWGFWKKPLYPTWGSWRWGVVNEQTEEFAIEFFKTLCTESGRAYSEMALWFLDPHKASHVDYDAILAPTLVFGGSKDRVVVPRISRLTAGRFKKGKYIEIQGSDHIMFAGKELLNTMGHIDQWLAENKLV